MPACTADGTARRGIYCPLRFFTWFSPEPARPLTVDVCSDKAARPLRNTRLVVAPRRVLGVLTLPFLIAQLPRNELHLQIASCSAGHYLYKANSGHAHMSRRDTT